MFSDDATLAELEAGSKPTPKPKPGVQGGRPRAPQQEERKVFSIDDELDAEPVSKKKSRKPQQKAQPQPQEETKTAYVAYQEKKQKAPQYEEEKAKAPFVKK